MQNMDGMVWDLKMLEEHLGEGGLWFFRASGRWHEFRSNMPLLISPLASVLPPSSHLLWSGADAWRALWGRISRNTAAVFSAALPHIRMQSDAVGALPGSTFEV